MVSTTSQCRGAAIRCRGATAKADLDDTLPTRLANGDDARALQMFAQQHNEGRRLGDEFARLLVDQMNARKLRMCGGE